MRKEVRSQKSEYRISRSDARSWKHSGFYILTSVFFLLFTSCQAQKSTPYYEDLSSLRPKVKSVKLKTKDSIRIKQHVEPIDPKYTVTTKVDAILDSIDRFNLTRRFVDGFTIQIYAGQKREEAMSATTKMSESISDLKANPIQYQQPKFRVTVGKYFTRLEAQKDLLRLKRLFSSAILVPERIMIK
jgi:hypothetical protein